MEQRRYRQGGGHDHYDEEREIREQRRLAQGPIELTEQEIKEMETLFDMFDKNNDGGLDVKELGKVFCAMGNNLTERELEKIMASADTDGNGKIDREEYKSLLSRYLKDPYIVKCELYEAFRQFDKDRNNKMDRKELRLFMISKGIVISRKDIKDLDQLMNEMDKDGDGTIDVDEFVEYMCQKPL